MLIELIKPLSSLLNAGSLAPIHLDRWSDSALEFWKKSKTVSAVELLQVEYPGNVFFIAIDDSRTTFFKNRLDQPALYRMP